MTVTKAPRRLEFLMWVGIVGAPAVWACQHVFGLGSTLAACGDAGRMWDIPIDTWVAIATSVAGLLAICGLVSSVLAYLAVRGAEIDTGPPNGRIYFMSICGIVISPLFLAIILLSGIGTLLLSNCHQG